MSTTDNYGQGIGLWSMTDAPSIPDAIQLLAAGVIPRGVLRFASASARGATLVGASAPVEGMVTWLQDTNVLELYDGSSWKGIFYGPTTWNTYAVTWSATTTNPAIGNGALSGSYMKVGTTCHIVIMLTIGSTTNKGAGTYRFSLPFTAATITNGCPGVLSGTFSRSTVPNHGIGDSPLLNGATTTDQIWFPNPSVPGDSNVWTDTQPWTPATGNVFRLYGTYQTAT